jgi:F-type H+-transporting ATPase subunit a
MAFSRALANAGELMALDLLTGTVQAYIFAVLATVFIASAAGERRNPSAEAAP